MQEKNQEDGIWIRPNIVVIWKTQAWPCWRFPGDLSSNPGFGILSSEMQVSSSLMIFVFFPPAKWG